MNTIAYEVDGRIARITSTARSAATGSRSRRRASSPNAWSALTSTPPCT
jgi:hypothetical protein